MMDSENGFVPIDRKRFMDFVEGFPKSIRMGIRSMAIDFLMRARWKPGYVATDRDRIWLERGELIIGRQSTSDRIGCSERAYRTLIDHLTKAKFLTIRTTNRFSIASICEYDIYCPPKNVDSPTDRPANRPRGDQPTDQEATTKEEGKEGIRSTYPPREKDITSSEVPEFRGGSLSGNRKALMDLDTPTPTNRWLKTYLSFRPAAGHPLGNLSDADAADARYRVDDLIEAHGEDRATELLREVFGKAPRPTSVKQAVLKCQQAEENCNAESWAGDKGAWFSKGIDTDPGTQLPDVS